METGLVILREYIYGWDFTVWDGDENVVIHESEDEALEELQDLQDHEEEIGGDDNFMIANGHIDENNYVIASDDNGALIVKSDEPINI